MEIEERIRRFREWERRLSAYRLGLTMIGLDANQNPPKAGAAYRGERRAILGGEFRRVLRDEAMFENLQELEEALKGEDSDPVLKRQVMLYLRQLRREKEVPAEAYMAFERARDIASRDWLRAKREDDFATFIPLQQEVIDRWKDIIAASRDASGPAVSSYPMYDIMLDRHQPGWTTIQYDAFFDRVRERIVPLLGKIMEKEPVRDDFLYGSFPADRQRKVMKKICELIGFTEDWGRISESEHPVTTTVTRGDIRFTTKYRENAVHMAILSSIHEAGHAYFGHQTDAAYEGTNIPGAIAAGMHESQSRLLENHLGRTEAFWEKALPLLKEEFPEELAGINAAAFTRAVNRVRPSLVRTQADEVTYPLHIMIRYELEKEFLGGDMKAKDLEEAWNAKYEEYLGIRPSKPSEGILQDMHWPYAYFGYFPTYALGSALAAQFASAMEEQLDVPGLIRQGDIRQITDWLAEHVHRFGGLMEAEEILEKATGRSFDPACYTNYLEKKYGV